MMTSHKLSFCAVGAMREFHVARGVREEYGLDSSLFSLTGNVVFADFKAARDFAHRINQLNQADKALYYQDKLDKHNN